MRDEVKSVREMSCRLRSCFAMMNGESFLYVLCMPFRRTETISLSPCLSTAGSAVLCVARFGWADMNRDTLALVCLRAIRAFFSCHFFHPSASTNFPIPPSFAFVFSDETRNANICYVHVVSRSLVLLLIFCIQDKSRSLSLLFNVGIISVCRWLCRESKRKMSLVHSGRWLIALRCALISIRILFSFLLVPFCCSRNN